MAIFTRRVLQRCLDEAHSFASRRKVREWVKKLNNGQERNYASTEWEIVLLHALSKLGHVSHPEETTERATLDVIFDSEQLCFGAEIVTISDRGLHEANPVQQLQKELDRRFRSLRIGRGGLSLCVNTMTAQRRGIRSKLPIPKHWEFDRLIFNADFDKFIEGIRANPQEQCSYHVHHSAPETKVSIIYDPRLSGFGYTSHTVYTSTTVIDKNPLYYALCDKLKQIASADYAGRKGVIVCDGGADALSERHDWNSYSTSDVSLHFLQEHPAIDFVLTLSLRDAGTGKLAQRVVPKIFAHRDEEWCHRLSKIFDKLVSNLPTPIQSPENAQSDREFWSGKEYERVNLGGMSMKSGSTGITEIRMSTRTLLDLLAGRLSQERFLKNYSFGNSGSIFETILRNGRLLTDAQVISLPDQDDDEIVLTFGGHDAAVGMFKRPPANRAT